MGRRAVVVVGRDPVVAQRQAAQALQRIAQDWDLARFTAQAHAIDMVEILAGLANDPTVETDTRRTCANDVLAYAYGRPGQRRSDLPAPPDALGSAKADAPDAISIEIDAVKVATERFVELSKWVGRVPEEEWPEHVRVLFAEQEAAFTLSSSTPAN